MAEMIVVGSGAAGTAAALELVRQGHRPLLLDVGYRPAPGAPPVQDNLYEYRRRHDSFDLHIGRDLAGLAGVLRDGPSVAKLNAPRMAFVTRDAGRLAPVDAVDFDPIQSFAAGGLANAWGAGLYRFVEADLAGFPIQASNLAPYFDALTREIGISGADDDLAPYFGETRDLLPPLDLSYNARQVYRRYLRHREASRRDGLVVGRPRVGALTDPKDGRPACDYSNLEFWQLQPYLYSPAMTLDRLVGRREIDYRPGVLVESWRETASGVTVQGRDVVTGQPLSFEGSRLLLAAGAINSAKIVLQAREDHETRLPLLENPILQIPFVLPASVGRPLETRAFGLVQLNLVWRSPGDGMLLQGSLVELTSPMRAEFFGRFPLSARANLALLRYLLPAMMVMQLYFPGHVQPPARLSLAPGGRLRIQGQSARLDVKAVRPLLRRLRTLGLWTHGLLIQQPVTGHAIHYAGTLPMRPVPGPYQCDPAGRLHGTRHVYVADSGCFSSLPAKNMSFGMMANAMRIAAGVARGLKASP